MSMSLRWMCAAALTAALAACSHNPIDPYAPRDAQAALTAQGAWRLLQATRPDGSRIDGLFVDGANLRLQFVDSRLTVLGGCNQQSGGYSVGMHQLKVGPLMSTRMACAPALMQVDADVARMLAAPLQLRWAAGGQRMTLHPADNATLLFEAIPLE